MRPTFLDTPLTDVCFITFQGEYLVVRRSQGNLKHVVLLIKTLSIC